MKEEEEEEEALPSIQQHISEKATHIYLCTQDAKVKLTPSTAANKENSSFSLRLPENKSPSPRRTLGI